MRIYHYDGTNRYVTCPGCHSPFEWEDGDLQIDSAHPEYFCVECTVCHEKMYLYGSDELKENYEKFSKK